METYLDCIPCFFRQALFAARVATADEALHREVLVRLGARLSDVRLNGSPPVIGSLVYAIVRDVTGKPDPFKELKRESTQKALSLYPMLRRMVETSPDPLRTAVRLAIAGNIIDFGANPAFELEKEVQGLLQTSLAVDHFQAFRARLEVSDWVLYLGDNAGETVFDRLLIETMEKPVLYAVRNTPMINDATREDADMAGLSDVARVLSSGCDAPGTILEWCSQEFRSTFHKAPIIISKGQGNFESLADQRGPLFHLLKVKCGVIAEILGVAEGGLVLQSAGIKRAPGAKGARRA